MNVQRWAAWIGVICAARIPIARGQSAPVTQPATMSPATTRSGSDRMPAPSAVEVAAAEKVFQQMHFAGEGEQVDHSAAGHKAYAKKLLFLADLEFDPIARYVLLSKSRNEAIQAADATGAVAAGDEMAREFAVDGRALRVAALQQASSHAVEAVDFAALTTLGMRVVDELMALAASPDDFVAAGRLGMATATWAAASRDSILVVKARDWNNDIQARCRRAE